MAAVEGLRVLVQGDLPNEVMERVGDAVRRVVLQEIASIDIAPSLIQVPLDTGELPARGSVEGFREDALGENADGIPNFFPILLGIWFKTIDSETIADE